MIYIKHSIDKKNLKGNPSGMQYLKHEKDLILFACLLWGRRYNRFFIYLI